jgi:hypothetical protein
MTERKPVSRWTLFGFAVLVLMLVSLPVVAIATGSLNDAPQYTIMRQVPERGDGAYLQVNDGTQQGVVKLYPWNFRLYEFPPDAPIFSPDHITGLVISQRGIDDPNRYHLYHLDDASTVPLDATKLVTKIFFTLRAPLPPGNYMIDMPKSGLSSDRHYLYFIIDPNATNLPIKPPDNDPGF